MVAFQAAVIFWLGGLSSPTMDGIMSLITSSYLTIIPLVILAVSLTKNKGERRAYLYRAIGGVLLTYIIVTFLKGVVAEPRPCAILPVRAPVGCETTGSFPSMHTALVFSVLPLLSGPASVLYFVYSALVGLSRIYLGVHYPLDVVAGAIVGVVIGKLLIRGKSSRASLSGRPSR